MAIASLTRRDTTTLRHSQADPFRHVDWSMLVSIIALTVAGLVAIYSAGYTQRVASGLDPYYYVKRQAGFLIVGFTGMAAVMWIGYHRLRDYAHWFFAGTTLMLMAVLVVARGVNGADAWFDFGAFQLQPSEFAKVTLVLMLAAFLARDRGAARLPIHRFNAALIIGAIPIGLVCLQPDLGTASVYVAITTGILLVAGANTKHVVVVTVLAAVTIGALFATDAIKPYQQKRLVAFAQQNSTSTDKVTQDVLRQLKMSKVAIASGGLTGQGFVNGPVTNGGFVPVIQTDFIFSAIGEQFGFAGAGLLLMVYAFLVFRLWRIAKLAYDTLGTLIAVGALSMLVWHVFQNVGMTMGIMPITGIPLPFLSYGGSSTVAFLVLMGLAESVHMRRYV
jgi:rod shape determining protein RodA